MRRADRVFVLGSFVTFAVMAVDLAAGRAAEGETIVIESYVGDRPSDASRYMRPLLAEMASAGFVTDSLTLGRRASRMSVASEGKDFEETARLVEDGYEAWLRGAFSEATDKLGRALVKLQLSAAVMAQDQSRRDLLFRCLVGLSLAHSRLGNADEVTRFMAELIRSFPDREVSRLQYGPEALQLYYSVKKDLDHRGRGALVVTVDDESVVIFLNERFEGVGTVRKQDLVPGRYRVYVQRGATPGRLHFIDVEAGGEARLALEWDLETALRSETDWFGLSFSSGAQRMAKEGRFATSVARQLGASSVIVVGIREHEGRRSLVGTVFSVETGRLLRSGILALVPAQPGPEQVRALGRFLAGGEAAPGIVVSELGEDESEETGPPAERRQPPDRGGSLWKWAVAGAAVVSLGAGAYLLSLDGDCKGPSPCPEVYDTRVPGLAFLAAGAAAGGLSVYLFVTDRPAPATTGGAEEGFAEPEAAAASARGRHVRELWIAGSWRF